MDGADHNAGDRSVPKSDRRPVIFLPATSPMEKASPSGGRGVEVVPGVGVRVNVGAKTGVMEAIKDVGEGVSVAS